VSACTFASKHPGNRVGTSVLTFFSFDFGKIRCPLLALLQGFCTAVCMIAGVVACYPSLQMHAMRDAKGLHFDLKKTASLELLHQQQVEAEERQSSLAAPDSGLGSSLSSAVKGRFSGRKNSGGGFCHTT
jgi:hypothetical protein